MHIYPLPYCSRQRAAHSSAAACPTSCAFHTLVATMFLMYRRRYKCRNCRITHCGGDAALHLDTVSSRRFAGVDARCQQMHLHCARAQLADRHMQTRCGAQRLRALCQTLLRLQLQQYGMRAAAVSFAGQSPAAASALAAVASSAPAAGRPQGVSTLHRDYCIPPV